jgi:hypothetical protein
MSNWPNCVWMIHIPSIPWMNTKGTTCLLFDRTTGCHYTRALG